MLQRRVVITGVGAVSALGVGSEEYFSALSEGRSGIGKIKAFDASGFPSQIAGEAPEFRMSKIVPKTYRKATKLLSRDIELAIVAADVAIRDAGLKTKGTVSNGEEIDIDPVRSGVNIGAGLICCDLVELARAVEYAEEKGKFSLEKWGREGMNYLTPLWLLKYLPNMPSCHISIIHDLQGRNNSITCAEVSGLLSMNEAAMTIKRDRADVMVAGGTESKVNPMGLLRQSKLGRLATDYNDRPEEACRPFDEGACGSVVAEGAGIVVLEELEHAISRGATIYAELKGCGASSNMSSDFVHQEDGGKGLVIAMRKALEKANIGSDDVQLLIPHGLGVPQDDKVEAEAIKAVFGKSVGQLYVYVSKGQIGNCGAASGALDIITAVMAMKEGNVPQTKNCPNPKVEYGLNITSKSAVNLDIRNAMVSCYTYGGQTAAVVVSQYQQ